MKRQRFLLIFLAGGLGLVGILLVSLSRDNPGNAVDLEPRHEEREAKSREAGLEEPLLSEPKKDKIPSPVRRPQKDGESGKKGQPPGVAPTPNDSSRAGPTGSVSGRVTDGSLRPVAGTEVLFTDYSGPEAVRFLEEMGRHGPSCPSGEVHAGVTGIFRLDRVPVGTIRVWAGAEGMFHSFTGPLEVRENEEVAGVDLILEPFAPEDTITGIVVTPEGEGVPGARIDAYYRTERVDGITTLRSDAGGHFVCIVEENADQESVIPHRPRSRSCTTDDDGSFVIHFEGAGQFSLFVRAARHNPVRTEPRLIDGSIGEKGIEITLSPLEK